MKDETYGHWNIDRIGNFNPDLFFGFIYQIEEKDTGRLYIGRKQFRTKSKKSNNWKEYISSSKEMIKLIEERGKEYFNFEILLLCSGKSQLTYEEEKYQFENDVLRSKLPNGEKKFFNKTIGYRNFNGVEKQTELTKQKLSNSLMGKLKTEEHKKNISKGKRGIPKTEEHKKKLKAVNIGKKYSIETNRKKGKGPNNEKLLWWNNGKEQKRSILPPDSSWKRGRIFVNNNKKFTEEQKEWLFNNRHLKLTIKAISEYCGMTRGTARKLYKDWKEKHGNQ